METTIKRKLTLNQMDKIFDNKEVVYIKFYQLANTSIKIENENEQFLFKIIIRHNENGNANVLFNKALKQIQEQEEKLKIYESKNVINKYIAQFEGITKTIYCWNLEQAFIEAEIWGNKRNLNLLSIIDLDVQILECETPYFGIYQNLEKGEN